MSSEYWAACDISEIAGKIESKFKDYRKWLQTTGYADRIRTSYRRFYALDQQGSFKIRRDKQDIARIDVNHFKSLVKRIHIIVTENKLVYQPKARNSDAKSQAQSDIGRGICDYYGDEKDMNGILSDSVLGSVVMLERWVHCPWDITEGYELTADDENIWTTGDQKFETYSAFDVASAISSQDSDWNVVRVKVNKHNQAAIRPDFADEILNSQLERDSYDMDYNPFSTDTFSDDEDFCYKYILYHKRTPAMPKGRWTEICAGQVLRDGPLRYPRVPLAKMQAGKVLDSVFCDSPSVDLLGIQEALNALFSGAITNGLNNSLQLLFSQDPNLKLRKLEDGRTLISGNSPPVALNLNNTDSGAINMINLLMQHAQLISGINDTARGNPAANVKTNGSMALLLAQAIQYVSDIQKSYARCSSEVASILLANLRTFGPEDLVGYIVGSSRKGQVRRYEKADIVDIERVTVDLGNPIMQNFAGRYELSQEWAQKGIMKSPKQIETFIRTGEIESITEDDFSDMLLIRDENEMLKRGEEPPVLLLDNHPEHIVAHKAIFSTPEARQDPWIVRAGLAHVQEHIKQMREVPPDLAAIIAGLPLPPPQAALPPGAGAPGQPPVPQVNGIRMPGPPPGTPPQVANNIQDARAAMPASAGPDQPFN